MLLAGMLNAAAAGFIKYIDDATDENIYGGRFRWAACGLAVLCAVATMYLSTTAAIFWPAITLGCLLAGKLDTMEFRLGGVILLLVGAVRIPWSDLEVVGIWATVAFADELLNRFSDRLRPGVVMTLLHAKPLMPVVALCMILGPPDMWLVVVSFDSAYTLTAVLGGTIARWDRCPDPGIESRSASPAQAM